MGADNSILNNVDWKEKFTDTGQDWIIENGELENGIEISMFTVSKKEKKLKENLKKLAKQLKGIRHPAVLHYIGFEEGGEGPVLITEQVAPLQSVLGCLSAVEICSGLHAVLEALSFLHEKAGVCHNNICQKSIYVCHDGSWRLGGLEYACKFTEATPAFLQSCRASRYEEAIAPEEKQQKIEVKPELGHARDVYSFAVLAEELQEKLIDLGDMTKTFELRIQDECLNPDPMRRPKIESLLSDRLFTTEFLQMATFLKNIALKNDEERKSFFMTLLPKLLSLPEELVGRRLVPLLLSRFVILEHTACQFVLPHLLIPCLDEDISTEEQEGVSPLMTVENYKKYVVPMLLKIFRVHDHHIRMMLLQYFTYYANLIDSEVLEFEIFPQLLIGLRDTSDELAASSLRALADLVPILGRDVVIGGRAKNYFRSGMPKTNTGDVVLTNNKANNVYTVMGKTLLKDLAKFSTQHNPKQLTEEDKEHKWKEKEKRREEAKLRREQRKLEREAKQKAMKISNSIVETERISTPKSEEEQDNPNMSEETGEKSEEVAENKVPDDLSEESFKPGVNLMVESDSSKENLHSFGEDVEKADWSDWDDAEIESQISEEIEEELKNMQMKEKYTAIKKDGNPKQTKPDDLDRNTSHSKSGALKLEKKVKPSESVNETLSGQPDEAEHSSTTKVVNFSSRKHFSSKSVTNKPATSNLNSVLGAEFDIKSVTIKVDPLKKADPFDFFADMAPTISQSKLSGDNTEGKEENLAVSEEKKDDMAETKVSFDMITTTHDEADGSGWGDAWENEDF